MPECSAVVLHHVQPEGVLVPQYPEVLGRLLVLRQLEVTLPEECEGPAGPAVVVRHLADQPDRLPGVEAAGLEVDVTEGPEQGHQPRGARLLDPGSLQG